MKKKILSLCLVLALAATAIIGGTLAYFTDKDSKDNVFSVGGIDIAVEETNKVQIGEEDPVDVDDYEFDNIMPNTKITKTAVVKNEDTENDAYVRVVVHFNKYEEVYDILGQEDENGNALYSVEEVFPGWDFSFEKVNGMRFTSTRTPGTDQTTGVELIAVDEIMHSIAGGTILLSGNNYFTTDAEQGETSVSGFTKEEAGRVVVKANNIPADIINGDLQSYIYYQDVAGVYHTGANVGGATGGEGAWIFYLKMPASSEYTLFKGINALPGFDEQDMTLFDGLEIRVCADAIQVSGFDTAKDAFEALQEAHPLADWEFGE